MALNVFLSLIIDSKITGSGKIGNGRVLVKLLQVIADNKGNERTHERNLLACFNDDVNKQDSYHKIDKKIGRFLPQGRYYPYEKLSFTEFEKCIGNPEKAAVYLRKMQSVCDEIIDRERLDSLVYTLLQIIRQDSNISKILYGSEFIPKNKLFGSYANPKRICVEALLLGLLYHVHNDPAESEKTELFEATARRTFRAVRFDDENSMNFELPIGLIENICDGAKHQKSDDIKYTPELRHENETIAAIPDQGNVFLYGTGGAGKSTLLRNYIRNENTINFYFSLHQYRREIHEKIRSGNCWILLNILLKYQYQYEYQTYETCTVCEGEDGILRQLAIIDREFKADPDNFRPKYVLLLDGMNEMKYDLYETFLGELMWIVSEWKNVRIIISGRIIPQYDLFADFKCVELCGIQASELIAAVSETESEYDAVNDEALMEILKIPTFLEIYLESHKNGNKLNKCGEVIDSYIMNWKDNAQDGGVIRFIVQFALPLVCKRMLEPSLNSKKKKRVKTEEYVYKYFPESYTDIEVTRQKVLDAIDTAIDLYIYDEQVYQNMVAPRKINKDALLESRSRNDFIELIINNISFVEVSYSEPHRLHFTHQFYRDYFAAKHILNAIEAIYVGYRNESREEKVEYIIKAEIKDRWFRRSCDFEDNYDALRMIGEISGDYKNASDDRYFYNRTLLDIFLDINYGVPDSCAADNVIRVMWISRDQVINGVDFGGLTFQNYLPTYAKYSGDDPCNFSESRIFNLQLLEFEDNHSYAVFGDIMLIVFNKYGNVVLWNMKEKRIVKEYSIFKSIAKESGYQTFYYEEISDDGKYFKALSDDAVLIFEFETGKLIKTIPSIEIDDEYDQFARKYRKKSDSIEKLSADFLTEVVSQMDIFRECDFRGVMFWDIKEKEMLNKMGAYCDMEEDNFIEERYLTPEWKWGRLYFD